MLVGVKVPLCQLSALKFIYISCVMCLKTIQTFQITESIWKRFTLQIIFFNFIVNM